MSLATLCRQADRLLWAAGLAALAYWAVAVWGISREQARLASDFDRGAAGTVRQVDRAAPIARLEAPSIGLSAMVVAGVDDTALAAAVGHVPATAWPGEGGNVGLAAHRDTFFRRLQDLQVGDRLLLTTPEETIVYQVRWTQVVAPEQVEVLDPTSSPSLTLVTCFPFDFVGPAPWRFVVRATPPRLASS